MTKEIDAAGNARQFVGVKFTPRPGPPSIFHNDGEPLAIGDMVIVTGRNGDEVTTPVLSLHEDPGFATTAIVGRAEGGAE